MHHALRNGHALPRRELDPPALQLDDEPSLHHVEELVLPVVLMPVELPLHHAEPHDTVVDTAQCLIIPGVPGRLDKRLNVDELKRRVPCIKVDLVRPLRVHRASRPPDSTTSTPAARGACSSGSARRAAPA